MPALPIQRPRHRCRVGVFGILPVFMACLLGFLPTSASARDTSFVPAFSLDSHLGEAGTVSTELSFSGSEYHGYVAPLTGLSIHLPAGIELSSAGFPTCSKETIEQFGIHTGKCPPGSLAGPIGSLSAVVWIPGPVEERNVEVQAVFGPGGAVYFVVEGGAPVALESVIEGHFVSDSPPYGKALVLMVPIMETDPHDPAVSITALTLNVGTTWEVSGTEASSATLPSACPGGTFAWAADAAFNGEASEPIGTAESACPPSGPRATTSTTLTVSTTAPKEEAPVTYTATVTPTSSGSVPAGTVMFYDGTFPLGGCTAQPLTGGAGSSGATCQDSYSDPGPHTIRAFYNGSEIYRGSLSHSQTIVVGGTEETPPKKEEVPPTHEEPASTGSSTSTSGTPATTSISTGVGSTPLATATISSAQVAALLGQQLVPSGKADKIAALLKADGLTMPFKALEAGMLTVGWYELPAGAKLAKNTKAKPVLVASGRMAFLSAGTAKLKIRLTAAGVRLLKGAMRVKVTAKGMFTPSDEAPVSVVHVIALRE